MNNNPLFSMSSGNSMVVDNHQQEKPFSMVNYMCVTSNSNNNHLISITNTFPGSGKLLSSFTDYTTSIQNLHDHQKVTTQCNGQFLNHNHVTTESRDQTDSKFGLPRQRSFDQGGEGRLSSSQVKQKLKECVLNKKNNKVPRSPITGPSPPTSFENDDTHNHSSNGSYQQPDVVNCRGPEIDDGIVANCHDDDFPIRKTSSLPNLKVRSALKQKTLDRRPSPLSKKRSKICSNNQMATGAGVTTKQPTISGLVGFSQCSVLNSNAQNGISSSNSLAQSHNNTNFGIYQPHLYDNENSQSLPLKILGNSTAFKSSNFTPQVDHYQPSFPTYQLPLQTLFNSPSQLVPSFNSLPNLNLGHSLTAILSANKTCGSVIDFSATGSSEPQNSKEMDSSCSQSPDMLLDHNSPLSPSTNMSLMHGYTIRTNTNSSSLSASRQRSLRVLNRTNSAPLPLGNNNNNNNNLSAVQLALQEQKLLFIKAQLRQKVLHRTNSGKTGTSTEDLQMSPEFDWKNVCTRTLSDSLLGKDRTPQRSQSLEESSSEIELSQPGSVSSFSPDAMKGNSSFQFRMLPNHSTNSGFSMQISNSNSITKLPSPILEEKILENPHTTAIIYDVGMLSHRCLCGNEELHPESSRRLSAILDRLKETQIIMRCHVIQGKKASMDDLQLCHEDTYSVLFGTNPANRLKINPQLLMSVEFCRLPCGGIGVDSDTVWNNAHTANAARLAVGCVVDLTLKIVRGELRNGFALVRPPGHNAEFNHAMGFGYFNSVAIAAKKVTMQTAVKRVLIIDWDIHHGNGTQQIFYNDPSVLYISLHRHDNGHFFPGTGIIEEIGDGPGTNYNINIAWKTASPGDSSFSSMSDAEYMAAFIHIVLPVAKEFNPDLILVSAGFDATNSHSANLGGYSVSPACFGWITQRLIMSGLAEGRVMLALEGGYDIGSLCDCVEVCMRTLIKPDVLNFTDAGLSRTAKDSNVNMYIPASELNRIPKDEAIDTLFSVSQLHKKKWQCFRYLSKESMKQSYNDLIKLLSCNKIYDSIPLLAMAELTVQHEQRSGSKSSMDYSTTSVRSTNAQPEPMDQETN